MVDAPILSPSTYAQLSLTVKMPALTWREQPILDGMAAVRTPLAAARSGAA
jgi:hypothetical protein